MKHIVCFSGGESSAIVALEVAERFGKENVVLINHNITPRSELADVKRFKKEVSKHIGIDITYANHPDWQTKDQFDVCVELGTFVNTTTRAILCTYKLKTEPFYEWLKQNYNDGDVIYYGFDANEPERITRRSVFLGKDGYKSDYPLALWGDRTFFKTADVGIQKPAQYDVFSHANCIGCLKAGWQHWYVVYCYFPKVWEKAKWAEDQIGYSVHRDGYFEDKEPIFEAMRKASIVPTEHTPSGQFWSTAKRAIRGGQVSLFDIAELPDFERKTECMTDCGIDRNV